jgi:predicted nuclease of predicted toxin-antitoxin system
VARFLSDENLNGDIVRGLVLRRPDLDLLRVQDVGLEGADDPTVLAWAAENGRILLTHDRATMPDFAFVRIAAGQPMAGVFVLNDRQPVRHAIDELLLIEECSMPDEWTGRVLYLPL